MDEESKKLLQENKEVLLDLEKRVQKIQNKMMWNTIGSVLKIVLIIGPIIWGAIYLSPILKEYTTAFKPLMDVLHISKDSDSTGTDSAPVLNLEVSPENQQIFCNPRTRELMVQQICN
ncbi:hypothetical protein HOB10_02870 [Candidatus Parcubacteria bacterium]|jgi:hypothetical protein|nr:hypothetical protein [Candidatus Parcubacteria bacterium]